MAETQTNDNTLVLDMESRISELETSFQESTRKMMKLAQKAKEDLACDKFDKLSVLLKGNYRMQESMKAWVEKGKARFENMEKKRQENFIVLIECLRENQADIQKNFDFGNFDFNEDDGAPGHLEMDIPIEEAERELYKILYGKYKEDQTVDERNAASLWEMFIEKDLKTEATSSWSDLLKQNSEREAAVMKRMIQNFKKLGEGSKTGSDLGEEYPSSSRRQLKKGSLVTGINRRHSI